MLDPVIENDATEYLESGDSRYLGERVLITGANGMLGSYLTEICLCIALKAHSTLQLLAFTRRPNSSLLRLKSAYPNFIAISTYEGFTDRLRNFQPTTVIHAASPASPEMYERSSGLIEANITRTAEILQGLKGCDSHLIFLSSGEVYGPRPRLPTREDDYSAFDHLGPRGAYPAAKRAAEFLINADQESMASKSILRLYHTYGPGVALNQTRIFSTVLQNLLEGNEISLRSDGTARRSFLYALDLARALPQVRLHQGCEVYNVAGSEEISISDFASTAATLVSPPATIVKRTQDAPSGVAPSPILRGLASTEKLRRLGWTPQISLREGLRRTYESVVWRAASV